jgi:gluconate 2-dehydrogenase gamma chain
MMALSTSAIMAIFLSRRELLKRAGLAGAAAAVIPADRLLPEATTLQRLSHETPETLTAAEYGVLEAVVARLIPTDASGPGATEARAARYIDRALGSALAPSRPAYAAGLAALDQLARTIHGRSFAELTADDQDRLLSEVEAGTASGFAEGSATFFTLLRTHTIQGTFCDPSYGGNANFVGWDLIGYPGVRTTVGADQQRLGITVRSNHKGAYDYEMFTQ